MTREGAVEIMQVAVVTKIGLIPKQYQLTDTLKSHGIDSLRTVEIMMEVEEELALDIKDAFTKEEEETIHTFEDIVKLIESR